MKIEAYTYQHGQSTVCPECSKEFILLQQGLRAWFTRKNTDISLLFHTECFKRAINGWYKLLNSGDLLKAKDYIQEFDNQIPREGL